MKFPIPKISFKATKTESAPRVVFTPRGWNEEMGGYYMSREERKKQQDAVALYKRLGNKFADAEHERIYRNRRIIDDYKPKNPFEDPNFYNNVIEDEWSTPPQPVWPDEFTETGEPVIPGPRLIGETIPWNWIYIFCGIVVWWCFHWTFVYYHDRRIKLYNIGTHRKAFGIPRSDNRPWEVAIAAARQEEKDKENRMRVKAGLHPLWDNPVTGKTEKLDEWDEYGHPIPPLPTKEELEKEEAEWERWWSKIVRRVERFDRKGYNLMPGALVDFAMDLYFTEWEEGMVLEDAPQPALIEPPPAPEPVPASRSPSPPKETRSRIEVVKPGQSARHRLPDPVRAPVDQFDAHSTSSKRSKHSASGRVAAQEPHVRATPPLPAPPPRKLTTEEQSERLIAFFTRREQQRNAVKRPQVLGHKLQPPPILPEPKVSNDPFAGKKVNTNTHMMREDGVIVKLPDPWLRIVAEREGISVEDVEMRDAMREKKKQAKAAASRGIKRTRDEFASSTDAAASATKKTKGEDGTATKSKATTSKAGQSSKRADESGGEVPPTVEDMTTTQDQTPSEPVEYLEEDGVTSTHPRCTGLKIAFAWEKGEWGFRVGALGQPERLCAAIVRKKLATPQSREQEEEAHLWLTEEEYIRARDHKEIPSETHDLLKLGPLNIHEPLQARLLATGRRILGDREILGNGRTDGIRQPKEGEIAPRNPNYERFLSPPRTPEERFMLPMERKAHRKKQKELAQQERAAKQEAKKREKERKEAERKEAERLDAEEEEAERKCLAENEAKRLKALRRMEEKSRTEPPAEVIVSREPPKDMVKTGYEPGVRVDIHGNSYKEEPKKNKKARVVPSTTATPKPRTASGSTTAVESPSQSVPSSSPAKTVSFAESPTAVPVSTTPPAVKEVEPSISSWPTVPVPALTVTSATPPPIFSQPAQAPPQIPAPQFVPLQQASASPVVVQPTTQSFSMPTTTLQAMDITPASAPTPFNPSTFQQPSANFFASQPAPTPQSAPQPPLFARVNEATPSPFSHSQPTPLMQQSTPNPFVQSQPNPFAQFMAPVASPAPFAPLVPSPLSQSMSAPSQPFAQAAAPPSTHFSASPAFGFGQPTVTPQTQPAPSAFLAPMNIESTSGSSSHTLGSSSSGAGTFSGFSGSPMSFQTQQSTQSPNPFLSGNVQAVQAMPVFTPSVAVPNLYNRQPMNDRPMSNNGAFARDPRWQAGYPGGQNVASAPSQSSPLATSQPQEPVRELVFMDGEGAGSVPSLDNFASEGANGTLQAVFGIAPAGQAVGSEPHAQEEFEEVAGQVPKDLNTYILQDRTYEEIDPCAPSSSTSASGSNGFPTLGSSIPGASTSNMPAGPFTNFMKSASGLHFKAQFPTAPRLPVGGPLSEEKSTPEQIQSRPRATNSRLLRGIAPRPVIQNPVVQPPPTTVPTPTSTTTPTFPSFPSSQPFMQFAQPQQLLTQQPGTGSFFAFSPQTTGPTLGLANNAFVQGMANTMDRHRAEERAAQGIPTHQNQDGIFSFGQH